MPLDKHAQDSSPCERCGQQPATVTVKHSEDGVVREIRLCGHCAGQGVASVAPLVDLLLSVGMDGGILPQPAPARACPGCGMTTERLKQQQRLGCADCYRHFSRDLTPMLREMQPGNRHTGKVPARSRIRLERTALERELRQAIAAQQFERAAVLRDRIGLLRDPREASAVKGGA